MSDAILIPTGRVMHDYVSMRSLNRRGIQTIVASEVDRIPHFSSRYCSEKIQLPSPHDDLIEYKDSLLSIAARPEVKTIIPVREYETYLFSKYLEEFEKHVSLVTPCLETFKRGNDRLQLAREAAKSGVPVAGTQLLSEVDEWDSNVVIKSRYNLLTGENSTAEVSKGAQQKRMVRFVEAGKEPDKSTVRENMQHDPIVQEYIPEANKHLYCALWVEGEPVATYQDRQIRKESWIGGGGVYRISAYSKKVNRVAYKLLSHLDWNGLVCIEYIKDKNTGEWKFLEINPRTWQSFPQALRSNADFPYYYWLCANGKSERIDPTYNLGVASHSPHGELNHLLSIFRHDSPFVKRPSLARTLWEISTSIVANPHFDYLHLDDPVLFLSALRYLLTKKTDSNVRDWGI